MAIPIWVTHSLLSWLLAEVQACTLSSMPVHPRLKRTIVDPGQMPRSRRAGLTSSVARAERIVEQNGRVLAHLLRRVLQHDRIEPDVGATHVPFLAPIGKLLVAMAARAEVRTRGLSGAASAHALAERVSACMLRDGSAASAHAELPRAVAGRKLLGGRRTLVGGRLGLVRTRSCRRVLLGWGARQRAQGWWREA